jgi:Helix-turn-helix domain
MSLTLRAEDVSEHPENQPGTCHTPGELSSWLWGLESSQSRDTRREPCCATSENASERPATLSFYNRVVAACKAGTRWGATMIQDPPELVAMKLALGQQLAASRQAAEFGQQYVGRKTGYSRSSIAKAESGRQLLTREFWTTADKLLNADGALLASYEQVRAAKLMPRTATAWSCRPDRRC